MTIKTRRLYSAEWTQYSIHPNRSAICNKFFPVHGWVCQSVVPIPPKISPGRIPLGLRTQCILTSREMSRCGAKSRPRDVAVIRVSFWSHTRFSSPSRCFSSTTLAGGNKCTRICNSCRCCSAGSSVKANRPLYYIRSITKGYATHKWTLLHKTGNKTTVIETYWVLS